MGQLFATANRFPVGFFASAKLRAFSELTKFFREKVSV
jgi:hypothetical protein